MLFRNITITDENFEVREHMNVVTEGNQITYIGSSVPQGEVGEVYEGENRLLLPAFYDLHTHLPMSLLRGYAENMPLMDWLNQKIFPFEAKLTDEDMYWGCLLGIAELLRFGIGSASEMYISHDPICRAFLDSGMKGNVSRSVTCFDPNADYFALPEYRETTDCIRKYHGADDGRLKAEFALHAEYTSNEKTVRGIAKAAKELGSSMHVHVSETESEVEACRARHEGKSPVQYLADCGLFDVPTIAAHCVWVDEADMRILREKNVSVATNPKSNLKLASGIAPVSALLAAGVNVGIGTDSVASNNNLNMIEEMRFLALLQKGVRRDPTLLSPKEVLYAATRAGAIAQGREDCGLIKEGFRADLTVLDIDRVYMKPTHDIMNNLLYSAQGTDVVMTVVDGRVLYRDGIYPTLDLPRITEECERARQRILASLRA